MAHSQNKSLRFPQLGESHPPIHSHPVLLVDLLLGFLKIGLKSISLVKLIHFLNHIKRSVKEMRIRSLVGRGLGHSGLILEGQLISVKTHFITFHSGIISQLNVFPKLSSKPSNKTAFRTLNN